MIENMVPVNLAVANPQIANQQLPLQKPEEQDVMKFQLELKPDTKIPTILETTTAAPEADNSVFGYVKGMESNYHQVLSGMNEVIKSDNNLDLNGESAFQKTEDAVRTRANPDAIGDEFVRTPADAPIDGKVDYKELINRMEQNQSKAMTAMNDMNRWTVSAQMYFSNVKAVGAAISQVSQGFKTLFRSSG